MAPACRHYGECGGCDFQEMEYAAQLEYKATYCRNLFASFGITPDPIIGSPLQRHFRNKMEFAVAAGFADAPCIGQRVKERYDRVVDLIECPVCGESVPALLEAARRWMAAERITPYDIKRRQGEMRYLSVKGSRSENRLMVTLVCALTGKEFVERRPRYEAFAGLLLKEYGAASVFVCLNSDRPDVAVNGALVHLAGSDHIKERINGVEYVIRPQTFFQTNPACCEKLYAAVLEYAGRLGDTVYDVYCGSGGIALQLAAAGKHATGIDLSQRNIGDAQENARLNGLVAEFICRDADAFIKELADCRGCGMVVDPPRNGLTGPFMQILEEAGPGSFVYVSCNPLKLREDLKRLSPSYSLERLVPVDMFPHTRYFEVVALLTRKSLRG